LSEGTAAPVQEVHREVRRHSQSSFAPERAMTGRGMDGETRQEGRGQESDLRVMKRRGTSEICVAMTEEGFCEGPFVLRSASAPAASKGPFPTFGL
jgi:hypothetical protein